MLKQLAIVCCCFLLVYCDASVPAGERDRQPVLLALPLQPSSGLGHIAMLKGFFSEVGLEVNSQSFASGKLALQYAAKQPEKVDLLFCSGVALLAQREALLQDYLIVASVFTTSDLNAIVVRSDSQVVSGADLEGRTIGTQRNSAIHYFANAVVERNGISDVTWRYYPAKQLASALASGDVDAISAREPFISQAMTQLDGQTNELRFPGVYVQNELLLMRRGLSETVVTRVLKGLLKAEDFVARNADQSKALLAEKLGASPQFVDEFWQSSSFRVSLKQSLVPLLESQQLWLAMTSDDPDNETVMQLIEAAPLTTVAKDRVSIITYD